MATTEYTYTPLIEPNEIRLVHIRDRDYEGFYSPIDIEFETAKIKNSHYSALSYVWGDTTRSEPINVVCSGLPRSLRVTKSLDTALRYLRRSGAGPVWIDALCINQGDVDERNSQVTKMANIYAEARDVIVWLGEADDDSNLAMGFIPNISVQGLDLLAADESRGMEWRALANLMRRVWFTRRWTIQEIAFARKAEIHCGTMSVPWTQFAEAVTLFETKADDINRLFRDLIRSEASQNRIRKISRRALPVALIAGGIALTALSRGIMRPWMPAVSHGASNFYDEFRKGAVETSDWKMEYPIGTVSGVGAHSLVITLEQIIRTRPGDHVHERLCTMEALLSYLPTFNASEPRDIIYAIASLAKDYSHVKPDYRKSPTAICKDAIEQAIRSTRSLNIISRPWAPITPLAPSWMSQISNSPFLRASDGTYVRRLGDPFVGHPNHCPYRACGASRASATILEDQGAYVLTAMGFPLGEVTELLEPAEGGVIPASWVRMGTRSFIGAGADEADREIFWRTLVANRDDNGKPAPSWMRRACEELYSRAADNTIDTAKLLCIPTDDPRSLSNSMKTYLRRVQAATFNRRMVRYGPNSLGLVPKWAAPGDRLCILCGCDVPVLLRQWQPDSNFWEFVGEAYIHGIMDGECVGGVNVMQDFALK